MKNRVLQTKRNILLAVIGISQFFFHSNLLAYASGTGTIDDPYILTATDTIIGSGYWETNYDITYDTSSNYESVYIGDASGTANLTINSDNTVVNAYSSCVVGGYGNGNLKVDGELDALSLGVGKGYLVKGTVIVNGTVTVSDCIMGYSLNSSYGSILTTGSTASLTTSSLEIGYAGTGVFTANNGASITSATCSIGASGAAVVTNKGSLWTNSSNFDIETNGSLTITNNALVVIPYLSDYKSGYVYLANGYLAIKGDYAISDIASSDHNIYTYDGSNYVPATISASRYIYSISATYYDGIVNVWSSSKLYSTYGSKVDLTGYTIITGGYDGPSWAEAYESINSNNWYKSAWYGCFYSDASWENWIYQSSHGWQYVISANDSELYIWDNASQSWWFVNTTWYPYMYDYTTSSWYYYIDGTAPNRNFWSYSTNSIVGESLLPK